MQDIRESEITYWYESYSEQIFRYLLIMTSNYQVAEDLTQETFIKAFHKHSLYQRQSSPKTWLYRLAYHSAIDYLRRKRRLSTLLGLMNPLLVDKSAEEYFIIKERSEELYKILNQLKPAYRNVIILRKMNDFSIEETSEILGWSQSKVKSTLFRAIKALDKHLQKGGILSDQSIRRESF